jgi:uncharacterized protein YcbX
MSGERLSTARVAPDVGIEGDRAFAIVDLETGTVASGKHPRKWGRLLACSAAFDEARGARIELPDGTRLDSSQHRRRHAAVRGARPRGAARGAPAASGRLEEYDVATNSAVGVPLSVGAGDGTFFDFAPIHW